MTNEEYKKLSIKEFTKAAGYMKATKPAFMRCAKKIIQILWQSWRGNHLWIYWMPDVVRRQ